MDFNTSPRTPGTGVKMLLVCLLELVSATAETNGRSTRRLQSEPPPRSVQKMYRSNLLMHNICRFSMLGTRSPFRGVGAPRILS